MSASVCRGQHPWPVRERQGETRVYSVPDHAGFSDVRGTALFIGKYPWRQTSDPDSWFVSEANLRTGEEWDRRVVGASVDTARQLRLQVLPGNFGNTPQWGDRFDPSTGHALAARGVPTILRRVSRFVFKRYSIMSTTPKK